MTTFFAGTAVLFSGNSGLEVYGQKIFSSISAEPLKTGMPATDEYILGTGDEIVINIWGAAEEEYREEIGSDGAIFIPGIGKITLEGRSLKEAKEFMRKKITGRYKNISVSISPGKLRKIEIFVLGEVRKPGSYIVSPGANIVEALSLAGGPSPQGSLRRIKILRRGGQQYERDLYPLFMSGEPLDDMQFFPGDTVFVPMAEFMAGIKGAVRRPGMYELPGKTKLEELIKLAGGLLPNADIPRIQAERPDVKKGRLLVDVAPEDAEMFFVDNFDIINIPYLPEEIFYKVSLEGAVRAPGFYGWKEGIKLGDLLKETELLPYALRDKAEIIRTEENGAKKVISVSPEDLLAGKKESNIGLAPRDRIIIYSREHKEKRVTITGQVYYSGEYVIAGNERLSDLVKRAGGFTGNAWLPGIVFMRETVKEQKRKQLETFISDKEESIRQEEARTVKAQDKQLLAEGKIFLQQLKEAEVKGRIALKIEDAAAFVGSGQDILLEDGDRIHIPEKAVSVAITGEVNLPANIMYKPEHMLNDYLERAGGFTRNADRRNIFVARTNGTATADTSNIEPGDTIVVPFEIKERRGSIIKDIVQMFYHISLGITAY